MTHHGVRLELRIDWSELDLFGHVNNVAYFKYVQAARVHYWEVSHLAPDFAGTRIGPILLSTSCQFIKPLFFPGQIVVESRVVFIKTTSFGLHHLIINADGETAAEANDVIVNFDFNKNKKVPVTSEFRQTVAEIEGRTF